MLAQHYSFLFFPCSAQQAGWGWAGSWEGTQPGQLTQEGYSVPYSIVFSRKTGVVKKEGSKRKELPSKVAVAQGQARHQPALFFFPSFGHLLNCYLELCVVLPLHFLFSPLSCEGAGVKQAAVQVFGCWPGSSQHSLLAVNNKLQR